MPPTSDHHQLSGITPLELSLALEELRAERSVSTLLPLVVGEAIEIDDVDDEDVYSESIEAQRYSEQLVISALGQIGPAVQELEGFAFELAARRVERILDTFWAYGRHHELHQAFNALSPELQMRLLSHDNEGILFTMADGLATELIETGRLPSSRGAVLDRVLLQAPDPGRRAAMAISTLRLLLLAQDQGWDAPQTAARLRIESEVWPDMVTYIYENMVCFLFDDLPENPQLFGARDNDIHDRLTAFSSLLSDETLLQVCESLE
jgi:hypothetical protein